MNAPEHSALAEWMSELSKLTPPTMRAKPLTPPTLAHKVRRATWTLVWTFLYRPSPTVMHGWRRFLLRCFGAEVHAGAHPYPSARVWDPRKLVMLEDSCLGPGVDCYNAERVTIGRGAIVSQKAYLCTASHEANDAFTLIGAPITLQDKAWVAASTIVGPGVTVERGAILGAGGVAMKDIPAGKIFAGNPAREIGESALGQSSDD